MNIAQTSRAKIAIDVPQPAAPAKPIPTEISDMSRSLAQLHEEIAALRDQLNGVLDAPGPASDSSTKEPTQSGMLGEMFLLHRGVRVAISEVQNIRERLML